MRKFETQDRNILRYCINTFLFIFIVFGMAWFLQFNTYRQDEFWWGFLYTDHIWTYLNSINQGQYLPSFWLHFILHGTAWIQNIHPNDNIIPKIIIGIHIALTTFLVSSFATYPFGKKISPIFIVISFFFLLAIFPTGIQSIIFYTQHFTYIFGLLFLLLATCLTAKCFINKTLPHYLPVYIISALLVAAIHINVFVSIVAVFFLFSYGFICFGIKHKWDLRLVLKEFYNLGKPVYFPLVAYVLGCIIMFSAPYYQLVAKDRGVFSIHTIISWIPSYIVAWYKYVLIESFAWLLFLLLIITLLMMVYHYIRIQKQKLQFSIIFSSCDNTILRTIVFGFIFIFAVLVFNATLIFSGNNMYGSGMFWVAHGNIMVSCRILILAILLLFLGCINTFQNSKNSTIINIVFMVIGFLAALSITRSYIQMYNFMKYSSANWYQTEKIYRFYALQGKKAILPANRELGDGGYWHEYLFHTSPEVSYDWTGKSYILRNYPIVYYRDFEYTKKSYQSQLSTHFPDKPAYYVDYILTNSNIALSLFKAEGGTITEEELKNPIFSKLFDEDFVLNTNQDSNS